MRIRGLPIGFLLLGLFSFAVAEQKDARYLQIAAFKTAGNAKLLCEQLTQSFKAPVSVKNESGWNKVQVGPLSPAAALALKAQIDTDTLIITPKTPANSPLLNNAAAQSSTQAHAAVNTEAATRAEAALSAITEHAQPRPVAHISTDSNQLAMAQAKSLADSAPVATVKNPTNSQPQTQARAQLWNLRNADIRSVIEQIALALKKNFVLDARVSGKISIISGKPIDNDELYQVFLSVLQTTGYSAVKNGDIIKIVPNIEARSQATRVTGAIGPGSGDENVVRVVPLRYVPSEQLVPALRPLIPQWSSISAYAPSNSLILSGQAANISRLVKIIGRVDTPSTNNIDIVPLKQALAQDVVQTIKNLRGNKRSVYASAEVNVAADDRSNSILLSGNHAARLRMRVLINELDSKSPVGTGGNTQVVFLRYMRAQDIVPILAGVARANFSGDVGTTIGTMTHIKTDPMSPRLADNYADSNSSDNKVSIPEPTLKTNLIGASNVKTTQQSSNTKPKVQIIAEPNTNAVVLNAPPSVMRILKSVVAQLDARPAQVLIEAIIAEIDESLLNQLGIEWGDVSSGTFRPGFAILNSKTTIKDFEAQVQALASLNKANILSTPSVVVLDNHQAKILVGKEVSIEQATYPGNGNGTSLANPYTTFSRLNVALHLYVTPQISQGDTIQLQIDHGNDTLQNPNDTSGKPIVNKSAIMTSVIVNNNDTLVLGGLTQNEIQTDDRKIPILGDLPGIGPLFQKNNRTRTKKVLVVFLKPTILSQRADNVRVTNHKYAQLRHEQLNDLHRLNFKGSQQPFVVPEKNPVHLPDPFVADSGYVK